MRRIAAAVLMLSLLGGGGYLTPASAQPADAPATTLRDPGPADPVGHGAYLARAADCMPCHTGAGQPEFSGGRSLSTPFGRMISPNITPDPKTGIGLWTDDQFYRLMHNGVGRHGQYIYPVMPFTSYTAMTRADVLAIKAYLFSLPPVDRLRHPNQLDFPFDIRASLLAWRILYFTPATDQADPRQSALWNRGAYLVRGPGHCGECHTPRNGMGALLQGRSLSGGIVDGFAAPNISADPDAGIGARSVAEITQFLRTGAEPHLGVAFGPMAEVVQNSTSLMTDTDLTAIATYLLGAEKRPETAIMLPITQPQAAAGKVGYAANCAPCHGPEGQGVPNAFPNLAGNAAVVAGRPDSVIAAMVNGLQGSGSYGAMPAFVGILSNADMAAIANYVRTIWGNHASANATPALVAAEVKAAKARP